MVNNMNKYKVIDLFCGIGGFSYGFEMTNRFEVIVAADIWDTAIKTFKRNHVNKNIDVLLQDITTLPNEYWEQYSGKVDVIIAGPPCQGFSMSGTRDINDKRNSLFEEVIRIAEIVNPSYIIIENVVGLLSMTTPEGQDVKSLIVSEFDRIGYKASYKVLNAADYGVPQARKRVVFIASKKYALEFPVAKYSVDNYVTVGDALGNVDPDGDFYFEPKADFQRLMAGQKKIENHVRRTSNALVTERMSYIPQGGNWRDIPEHLGTGGGVHSNAYKRLDPTKPSVTIKHAAKAMILHPDRDRILTVREVARLQSFADNFVIEGTGSDQHQQLANAVPPLLGKAIAETLARNLDTDQSSYTFIDLFAGMGGFRLAFEAQGCKCVFRSEIDKFARDTYFNNFGEYPSGDITKIKSEDIPDFDILCAGFPCQPFSIAGKRLGFEDTRGTLFFEVARIIKDKKPRAFVLENVKGLVNHDKGNTVAVIESALLELGYTVKWRVLNALKYGVPQNRERWYCIGIRNDVANGDIVFPEPCGLKYDLSDIITDITDDEYDISDRCLENIQYHVEKNNIEVHDYTLAYEVRPSKCQFANNMHSPCLTAKMGTGGNNVPIVVKQQRKLTEEECKMIMGYPATYKVTKGYQTYKQLGNSVVVPLLTQLAEVVVARLKGE